jgi:rRNA-processing protein FCF1
MPENKLSMQATKRLLQGWEKHLSNSRPGMVYYFNHLTGQKTWDHPYSIHCVENPDGSISQQSTPEGPETKKARVDCSEQLLNYVKNIPSKEIHHRDSVSEELVNVDASISTENKKKYRIVLDTNILMHQLPALRKIADLSIQERGSLHIVIPHVVKLELKMLESKHQDHPTRDIFLNTASALAFLLDPTNVKNQYIVHQGETEANIVEEGLKSDCLDDLILDCYRQTSAAFPDEYTLLLSNDKSLCIKAIINGIWAMTTVKFQEIFQIEESPCKENNACLKWKSFILPSVVPTRENFYTQDRNHLVIDTDVLLNRLELFKKIRRTNLNERGFPYVTVPWTVAQKLDCLKNLKKKGKDNEDSVGTALNYLLRVLNGVGARIRGQTLEEVEESSKTFTAECHDDKLVQTCLHIAQKIPRENVILLCDKPRICAKAKIYGIRVMGTAQIAHISGATK